MLLPPDNEDFEDKHIKILPPDNEEFEDKHIKKSLQNLGETIVSLLGSKKDLTFTWAESVRLIVDDLSSAINYPDSPRSSTYLKNATLSEKEQCDLESSILKLEDEQVALKFKLRELDTKRRETLNKLLDLKGNIRVFCRVRPFLSNDKQAYPGPLVVPDSDRLVIKSTGGKLREYSFDKVFLPGASQDEIFTEVEPIIRSALDGHNVCIFAYGQTGTGKTFTMEGTPDCPGVVPHSIQELFHQASLDRTVTFTFTFSMLEVYMGNLRDLLAPRTTKSVDHTPKCLSIQMVAKGAVEIENLREVIITNAGEASKLYGKGRRARSTAWTNANEASSRSHCLIRISISCAGSPGRFRDTSKLWMVDLGGSERLLKTQSTGQTMEEGKAINMSLSALGDVVSALQKKQAHVPYRNSKLTQILRDSLGEDSKMLMLVHVSPKEDDLSETICSLGFATRVRGIHLGRELTPELKVQKAAAMAELMQHMRCLEDDCQSARNNIHMVEFLLREKKKLLAKGNPSSEYQETPESSESQETETHSIILGNVARGSVGLPRYMNSTACSRIRGKTLDAGIKSPGSTRSRAYLNNRRKSSLGSASSVIFPEMERSLCDSESSMSNKSVHRHSSLSRKKKLRGIYYKKYDTDESQCFSECNTPRDSGMLDDKKMNGTYSKQCITFDEYQFLPECSTQKDIGMVNTEVNVVYSKPYVNELQCLSGCNTPKDDEMLNNIQANKAFFKECTFGESECFVECNMPDSGLVGSSMPRCKRVIAFDRDILSNNAIEKAELTLTTDITCNQPIKDEKYDKKSSEWKPLTKHKKEHGQNPSQGKQNSKQSPSLTLLKPQISREETILQKSCEKTPSVAIPAAATAPMTKTGVKTRTILEKAKCATIEAKPRTGLYAPIVKIACALWSGACLGVGLLSLGLGDDFFNGLLL